MAKRKKRARSGLLQRALIFLSCAVLVLCAASITYGFFLRRTDVHPGRLRIEVLNGTGERGLAQRAALALMRRGIDVFKVGNAERFSYRESILISRRKNPQVKLLANVLGCENTIEQLRRNAIVDATLILGSDYQRLKLGLREDLSLPD